MKQLVFFVLSILFFNQLIAQDMSKEVLPYYEIPEYPETYTAGTVAARVVDGLGYRYYWATEGLRDEDLAYKPSDSGRTTAETIDHIYDLSNVILNAALQKVNVKNDDAKMTFEQKRKKTLENFKEAADIFRTSQDISVYTIKFGKREFPFWNGINGPIEDAVWHCGQVVLLRRASGNPFNSKANVFTGKLRE
ncbi:hypothetical protein [Snuella sedimenti]|nr:hypothetical protein [Snuella sedimenti]